MKKLLPLVAAAISLFSLVTACAGTKTLRILHTNDMHAGYVPHEAFWIQSEPKPMVGGFKELCWAVDSIRPLLPATFLLDAGDVMTGTPIADYRHDGVQGGALFAMMNAMRYDAWEIGNHDLDISQENLKGLTGVAKFPTLSANLADSAGGAPFGNKPYTIIERSGVSIGVIGIMSRELFQLTNTNNLKGLVVAPPVAAAQRWIDSLQGKVDLIVALTHQGVEDDSTLAANTHGLGVIVGGHSHTRLKTGKTVNGVLICQAGSNCENLGILDLTIDDHKVVASDEKLLQLWARHQDAATVVSPLVDEAKTAIDKDFHAVIATLGNDWKRNGKAESNVGWYIAEVLRDAANATIGVTNSSGIRKDLSAGPVRKSDLYEVMPFRNTLCTFVLKGKELRALAQKFAQGISDGRLSLQLAGVECGWKVENGAVVVLSLTAGGKEIADDQSYTCASTDFLVNQGEKYLGFVPAGVKYRPETVYDLLVRKVEREKSIEARLQPHFKQID